MGSRQRDHQRRGPRRGLKRDRLPLLVGRPDGSFQTLGEVLPRHRRARGLLWDRLGRPLAFESPGSRAHRRGVRPHTESFTTWTIVLCADLVAIVPAIKEGNVLSAIYVIRAFVLILITFCFMTYFELRVRRRSEAK